MADSVVFPLRWAIFGTSFISGVIVDAIRASAGNAVYCVAGRSLENTRQFAAKHNIEKVYLSYDDALADPRVDVVYIGLPTYMHAKWVGACAQARKHILCEKSFAVNAKETAEALDIVRDNSGVFCMEAQMYRCHPIVQRLKSILTDSPVGKPLSVDSIFTAPILELFNRTSGGSILDLGCYPVSLTRYLFGEPLTVSGSACIIEPSEDEAAQGKHAFDADSTATMGMPGGVVATIRVCNREELKWVYVINCESGRIELSNLWDDNTVDSISVISTNANNETTDTQLHQMACDENFYTMQINVVRDCIARGGVEALAPAMNWTDTHLNMVAMDEWRKAIGLAFPADDN